MNCRLFQVLLVGREFPDNLHVLQGLAVDDFSSDSSESPVSSKPVSSEGVQQFTLCENLRQQSSTRYLLYLASDSLFDSPTQVVHEVSWKIDLLISSKEVHNQFVIHTRLVRSTSLLKKAICDELQKHLVVTFYIHQFGC